MSSLKQTKDDLSKPLTADEFKAVLLNIDRAKAKLVIQQPFYASLVLQRPLNPTYRIPTAGADARGRIYYNPRFLASKEVGDVQKIVFLLAHEVLHIAFNHCHKDVIGQRDPKACNIAMDKVINELLIKDKVGEFIAGGMRHPGAENMKWQDLYNEDDGKGGGGGGGGIGDDLMECPDGEPSPAEAEALQAQAKVDLAQAAQSAKMQGKLSSNVQRLVDDLLYVKTPWYDILSRWMQGFVSSDYSWKRPNRRMMAHGMYLPGLNKTPSMGEMVIGVDTSGSIGAEELAVFGGHINRIIEECVPEKVHVVYCDSQVAHVDTFTPEDFPVKLVGYGGGGTDMTKVWAWQEEHAPDADCLALLTDCYTPWPDAVSVPSVVLSTTDQSAPESIAETVKFSKED